MKKLFAYSIVFAFIFACLNSCEQERPALSFNNNLLNEFAASEDFYQLVSNNPKIMDLGVIDYSRSNVESFISMEKYHYILNVIISRNGTPVGQVIGYDLRSSERKIKTGHKYMMAFRDLQDFDISTKSGTIYDYDLNFDSFLCGTLRIENNIIAEAEHFIMPNSILKKYSFSRSYNINSKNAHPCDSSGEGDISFGECYICLKEAIDSDGTTKFLCDVLDIGFLCSGSVVAACILISSTR